MENAGFPSFTPYVPVPLPPEGHFRLMVGRCAAHTHVSTQNNLYLNELVPENELWINTAGGGAPGHKRRRGRWKWSPPWALTPV